MWQHAKVYDAIITKQLHRLDLPRAELSWHIIWLWHDGYIGIDQRGEIVRAA